MKIFTLDTEYNVVWEPQIILLAPFKAIFDKDKSKDKSKASKELAFVWFFTDIRSDYQIHTDETTRQDAIRLDLKLGDKWEKDKIVEEAIAFYTKMSSSITANILRDSMYVATKLSGKMRQAVDADGSLDIAEISKLIESVKKMPDVIKAIQVAEQAVIKEIQAKQDHTGSKQHALFEDGI